jgi:hypothetical protein
LDFLVGEDCFRLEMPLLFESISLFEADLASGESFKFGNLMMTLLEERGIESYFVRVIDRLIGASFYLIGNTYSLICFYSYRGFLLYFTDF